MELSTLERHYAMQMQRTKRFPISIVVLRQCNHASIIVVHPVLLHRQSHPFILILKYALSLVLKSIDLIWLRFRSYWCSKAFKLFFGTVEKIPKITTVNHSLEGTLFPYSQVSIVPVRTQTRWEAEKRKGHRPAKLNLVPISPSHSFFVLALFRKSLDSLI